MTILVDADVILDVALKRQPHFDDSAALIDSLAQGKASGLLAWHSLSNIAYITSVQQKLDARPFLLEILKILEVAPVSTMDAARAATMAMTDFEDAMQAACALACNADFIATRNIRDYRRSPVQAETPANLLKALR